MAARNGVTRTEFNALKGDVNKILALLEAQAPAKAQPKAAAKPAKKAPAKKAVTVKHLCRKNRAAFVKAHPWAAGLSTQVIASMVVQEGLPLAKGWGIGERYTEMFAL